MKFSHRRKTLGFTLIELLVVISIIGMLSSVVMASLGAARAKARNSYTIQTIRQYINAIEFLRDNNGMLPLPNGVFTTHCLGTPVDGKCGQASVVNLTNGGNDFNNLLSTIYPSHPTPNPRKTESQFSPGATLFANAGVQGATYLLFWTMEKRSDSCVIAGAVHDLFIFDPGATDEYYCSVLIKSPGTP